MDFDLSADQIALRDAAAQLLDRHASRQRVRARVGDGVVVGTLPGAGAATETVGTADAPAGYDAALWSAMADQGWLAVERPEADGGLGLGMVEVAVLCEALGRHTAPAPFLSTVLALDALGVGADAGSKPPAAWAEGLASGELVGCVAWSARHDAVEVSERAGVPHLRGRPEPVLYAPSADVAVVAAGDALFALSLDDGKRPDPQPAMDRTRELGWLELDDVAAVRVGGAAAAARLLDRAATGTSAELLGGAARVLEMSVDYAKDRVQFNKPIGSFQAIKHRLADALVDVEGMRSTAYYAAWCTASEDPEADLAASMAKAWCSDASRRVLATGLQVHGGIGFTWEHDLHLFLKRGQLDQVSYGDAPYHKDRIARLLRERLAAGRGVL
ncbi:MAG: acyl-CoA dehydrogenase family protein [Acidimicrobiales bacterium]